MQSSVQGSLQPPYHLYRQPAPSSPSSLSPSGRNTANRTAGVFEKLKELIYYFSQTIVNGAFAIGSCIDHFFLSPTPSSSSKQKMNPISERLELPKIAPPSPLPLSRFSRFKQFAVDQAKGALALIDSQKYNIAARGIDLMDSFTYAGAIGHFFWDVKRIFLVPPLFLAHLYCSKPDPRKVSSMSHFLLHACIFRSLAYL